MPRQVFAGGPDDYYESIGWFPPNRRGGGGLRSGLGAGAGRRRRRGGGRDSGFGADDPFSFDPSQGDWRPPGDTGGPNPPTVTPPINIDDWVKQFMLSPGRFENQLGDLIAGSGVGVPNAPAVPTFEEMFNQYNKAQQYTREQQIAELGEAFGSRGAGYGTDILQAQTNARSRFVDENAVRAHEYLTTLENQRQGRETQRQNLLQLRGNWAGTGAQLEEGRRALAYGQAFADFMRQVAPPPLLAGAAGSSGSAGGTVAY